MTQRTAEPGTSYPENEAIAATLERAMRRLLSRGGSRASIRFPEPVARPSLTGRGIEDAHTTLPVRGKGHKATRCNCSHLASTSSSMRGRKAGCKLCTQPAPSLEAFYIKQIARCCVWGPRMSPSHSAPRASGAQAGEF